MARAATSPSFVRSEMRSLSTSANSPNRATITLVCMILLPLEADIFLNRHESDLSLHQLVDELDHLAQAAAQAGQLADDQAVPRGQLAQQLLDAPRGPALPGGCLRLDEAVDGELLLPRVVEDRQLLIGQVLGTLRNAQVGDRFHAPRYKKEESDF